MPTKLFEEDGLIPVTLARELIKPFALSAPNKLAASPRPDFTRGLFCRSPDKTFDKLPATLASILGDVTILNKSEAPVAVDAFCAIPPKTTGINLVILFVVFSAFSPSRPLAKVANSLPLLPMNISIKFETMLISPELMT